MSTLNHLEIFKKYVPEAAAVYCFELWQSHKFHFAIKQKRKSKLGDYRFSNNKHYITVNGDLNKYSFLVTYLHEVAHLQTQLKYKNRVLPHGKEWKAYFKALMQPMLDGDTFPENLRTTVAQYMADPKASSCTDPELYIALRQFDDNSGSLHLTALANGDCFYFNGRLFRRENLRRTRVLCTDLGNHKRFVIQATALVEPADIAPDGHLPTTEKDGTPTQKPATNNSVPLIGLASQAKFKFRNRVFIKKATRRTRVLCHEPTSGQDYLIAGAALVIPLNS